MAYNVIEDFRLGLDRRRKRISAPPGSLWTITNAHITRGAEVERAKKFVSTYSLPAGQTHGFAAIADTLYVFGSVASPSMPAGVSYQRLVHPDGTTAMAAVRDVTAADGKLYVAAEFADGNVFHYYDGALVLDWTAGRVETWMANNDGIAAHFAQLVADVPAASTKYTFGVAANVITITHKTTNKQFTVETTADDGGGLDDQTAVAVETVAAGVGTAEVWTVTIGGTFQAGDQFTIEITDTTTGDIESYGFAASPDPVGTILLTFKSKLHAAGGTLVNFAGVNTPTRWNRDSSWIIGEGFINASTQDEGAQEVTALQTYQGQLAIFSPRSIQLWQIGADPANNAFLQSIKKTGTRARKSVLEYGSNDCFYLSSSGVRSLRAREASNAAFVNDVGTSIDTLVQSWMASVGPTVSAAAAAAIEPLDGRYWLAIGNRIHVYSAFPQSKVSAWSIYEPGFTVSAFAEADDRVYARSGDTIYLYGGADGTTYPSDDEQTVTVELPFLSAQRPASEKEWPGIALALENEWRVKVLPDPRDETVEIDAGTFDGVTYHLQKAGIPALSTHVALKLTCTKGGAASIAALALDFRNPRDNRL